MTTFTIWFPIAICALTCTLYCMALLMKWFRPKRKYPALKYGILTFSFFTVMVLLLWWFKFTHATPDECWQEKTKRTDTVIVFGFGYVIDENGNMLPGEANKVLYDMAVSYADTPVLNLIMQEGVMVAARADANQYPFTRNLIRMHPIITVHDVNTLAAARYAIQQMDRLNVKSAVVYAHSMQLARAVYDLKKIAASNTHWQDYEFITPKICSTPFPHNSAQWRTRYKLVYFPWELGARVYESLYFKYLYCELSGTHKHEERGSVGELVNKEEKGLIMDNAQQVKQKGFFKNLCYYLVVISIFIINIAFILLFAEFFTWEDDLLHKYAKDKSGVELISGCLGLIWPGALVMILLSSSARYHFFLFLKEKFWGG